MHVEHTTPIMSIDGTAAMYQSASSSSNPGSWRLTIASVARKPPSLPYPDIGHMAKWSVSSYKFGFGPECLQDRDPDTFWQYVSDLPCRAFTEFVTQFGWSAATFYNHRIS